MASGKKQNIHAGHRERMRQRFRENELEGFQEHEILELLLFYAIPRGDMNGLAHRLIERYGSLASVLDADVTDLTQVDGIGDSAATLLKLIPPIARAYQISKTGEQPIYDTSEKFSRFFAPRFIGRTNEVLYMMCLDGFYRLIMCKQIAEGVKDAVDCDTRTIVDEALRSGAQNVVLAHNHPGNVAIPSDFDIARTQSVKEVLAALRINLLDHLVFADGQSEKEVLCDFVSFAESRYI